MMNGDTNHHTPAPPASASPQKYKTLLMDMDGVLAEVSKSYRAAIERTCHAYGAKSVTQETITQWKIRGNANNDWKLSHALILDDPDGRNDVTLQQVTETFERFYLGDDDAASDTDGAAATATIKGLYTLETLIPSRETLQELRQRSQPGVGIVTGRPRRDCLKFLQQHGLQDLVDAVYCMEDGPTKPDPFPVLRVCELLGVPPSRSVVLVGDTPDDVSAAISAGCSAVGVVTPEARNNNSDWKQSALCVAMKQAGADVLLEPGFEELVERFETPELKN